MLLQGKLGWGGVGPLRMELRHRIGPQLRELRTELRTSKRGASALCARRGGRRLRQQRRGNGRRLCQQRRGKNLARCIVDSCRGNAWWCQRWRRPCRNSSFGRSFRGAASGAAAGAASLRRVGAAARPCLAANSRRCQPWRCSLGRSCRGPLTRPCRAANGWPWKKQPPFIEN